MNCLIKPILFIIFLTICIGIPAGFITGGFSGLHLKFLAKLGIIRAAWIVDRTDGELYLRMIHPEGYDGQDFVKVGHRNALVILMPNGKTKSWLFRGGESTAQYEWAEYGQKKETPCESKQSSSAS